MNTYLKLDNSKSDRFEKIIDYLNEISISLTDLGFGKELINKFKSYIDILKILDKENIPLFFHDLASKIGSLKIYLFLINKGNIEVKKEINEEINQLLLFINDKILYLEENSKHTKANEIRVLLGTYNQGNQSKISLIENIKERLQNEFKNVIVVNGSNYDEKKQYESDLILINFKDSDLEIPSNNEFIIIIENLIRNSIKSFKKGKKYKSEAFIITCTIKDIGDGKISFSIGDNGLGINIEELKQKAISIYRSNPEIVIEGIREKTLELLKNLVPENKELSVNDLDIEELVFADGISTFGTLGKGLYEIRKLLEEKGGNINVGKDEKGDIVFNGIYVKSN